jgi:hypothetical protein
MWEVGDGALLQTTWANTGTLLKHYGLFQTHLANDNEPVHAVLAFFNTLETQEF